MGAVAQYGLLSLVILFVTAPIVFVVIASFNSGTFNVFPPPGFSLQWYFRLLTVPDFATGVRNSLLVAIASSVLSVGVGTVAAYALVRWSFKGRSVVQGAIMSPLVIPKIAVGLALFILFLRIGLFGSLESLALAHAIETLPLSMALMTANFLAVPRVLEEAGLDLGAGPLRTFLRITLPQVRAGLAVSALLAFTLSFDEVETSIFLVRRENITLPVAMLNYMLSYQDPTIAALSTLLLLMSIVVVLLSFVALRGRIAPALLIGHRPGDNPREG